MNKAITKEEFDEKYVGSNLVVNCKTFELSQEFRELADKFGYEWCTGASYIDVDEWFDYKDKTCYELYQGMYSPKSDYKKHGYDIIEFNGIKEHRKEKSNIFKVIISLVGEEGEFNLIMFEENIQKSLRVLVDQKYKDVFFEMLDKSVLYTKKEHIKYVRTEVL